VLLWFIFKEETPPELVVTNAGVVIYEHKTGGSKQASELTFTLRVPKGKKFKFVSTGITTAKYTTFT
jgi:hypothetical protein